MEESAVREALKREVLKKETLHKVILKREILEMPLRRPPQEEPLEREMPLQRPLKKEPLKGEMPLQRCRPKPAVATTCGELCSAWLLPSGKVMGHQLSQRSPTTPGPVPSPRQHDSHWAPAVVHVPHRRPARGAG